MAAFFFVFLFVLRLMRFRTRNPLPLSKKEKHELYILWRHQRGVIYMFTLPPESDFSFCKVAAGSAGYRSPPAHSNRTRGGFCKIAMQMRACTRMAAPSLPLFPSNSNIGLCHKSGGLRHSPGYYLCFFLLFFKLLWKALFLAPLCRHSCEQHGNDSIIKGVASTTSRGCAS